MQYLQFSNPSSVRAASRQGFYGDSAAEAAKQKLRQSGVFDDPDDVVFALQGEQCQTDKDGKTGETRVLAVDNVIICAGQESYRELFDQLADKGVKAHLIGGADVAEELDAKRAIRQGTEIAAAI